MCEDDSPEVSQKFDAGRVLRCSISIQSATPVTHTYCLVCIKWSKSQFLSTDLMISWIFQVILLGYLGNSSSMYLCISLITSASSPGWRCLFSIRFPKYIWIDLFYFLLSHFSSNEKRRWTLCLLRTKDTLIMHLKIHDPILHYSGLLLFVLWWNREVALY